MSSGDDQTIQLTALSAEKRRFRVRLGLGLEIRQSDV